MEGPGTAAIAVDVGGTKIAAGRVGADGKVSDRRQVDTPARDPARIAELIVELATELGAGDAYPLGVGAPGLVDNDGVVRYSPNVDWDDYPLRDELSERLGQPVALENDANAAAWGEYRVGGGQEAGANMVMLTIGTGVGGGLILADRLIRGTQGLSAEFGHAVIAEGGPLCNCGNRGDLESLASGSAIGRTARERLGADHGRASLLRDQGEVNGRAVTEAARAGDELALEVLAECGFWLGVGIGSLVNQLDPEVIVVGGGGVAAGDLLLEPARVAAAERVMGRAHRRIPPVVPAELGGDAGLVGVGLLVAEGR